MHIIIAVLTAVGGIIWALYALQRSGVDLNSFNPFLWKRRKEWEARRALRPVHALTHPIEVAATLLVAVAREGGELLAADRERLVQMFTQDLKLPERQARELYSLADHMLREGPSIIGEVAKVVGPCKGVFTPEQVSSLTALLPLAAARRPLAPRQSAIVSEFAACFGPDPDGRWGAR